jgi:hypothetical protein
MDALPAAGMTSGAARRDVGVVARAAAAFLLLFLLVFPKGGFRVGPMPLTWGYLGLALALLGFPLLLLRGERLALSRARLAALAALAPFQLLVWVSFLAFGAEDASYAVAMVLAVFALPTAFVLCFAPWIDRVDLGWLFRWLRWGVFAVAVYGIFLFVWKTTTGNFIEIPFLTVNQGDVGTLEQRHINRGAAFKLISTYNNGNLYGVALLLLLPVYCWAEKSWVRVNVVKLSLLLTLSRTVWIGLVLHEIVQRLYVRRPTVRTVLVLMVSLAALLAGVWWAVDRILGFDVLSFLFDANLGGRSYQLRELEEVGLLPSVRFIVVSEIVYLSIAYQFGILGLGAFLLGMTTPLALHRLGAVPHARSGFKRALAGGLAIWLVIAMADGGFLVIPIMAFYWCVVSLLLSDNPTWPAAAGRPEAA